MNFVKDLNLKSSVPERISSWEIKENIYEKERKEKKRKSNKLLQNKKQQRYLDKNVWISLYAILSNNTIYYDHWEKVSIIIFDVAVNLKT